jgi:ribosome maturation factor RimP
MSLPFEIENKREAIRQEVEAFGADLLEIQFRRIGPRSVITLIVDKLGGVTLDDCVKINQRIGRFLDDLTAEISAETPGVDFLKGSYFLEVNSPGLDRPLKTERDFARAVGQTLRLTVRESTGATTQRVGKLESVAEGALRMKLAHGEEISVPESDIVKAVREIQFKR